MIKKLLFFKISLIFFFSSTIAWGQDNIERPELDLDEFIQNLFSTQSEDINYEDVYETLFQFYRNPINLNEAEEEDLRALYILTELQLNNLFDYKKLSGNFVSIYELQAIEGFDEETINKLLPFVVVEPIDARKSKGNLLQRLAKAKRQYFFLRYDQTLEKRRGFNELDLDDSVKYLGGRGKTYLRFRNQQVNDFSIGVTLENDYGEPYEWNPDNNQYGADFISYHATFYNQGNFKTITVGDYQVQAGQGLLLSAGFQVGKGAETVATTRRASRGVRPYTSALEAGYFKGAAFTYEYKNFEVTPFFSYQKLDGNVIEEVVDPSDTLDIDIPGRGGNPDSFLSAIYDNGFHRSLREINRKDQVSETVFGAHLKYKSEDRRLKAGIVALQTYYGIDFNRKISQYNQFDFRGSSNLAVSGHATYRWKNFDFFGEVARSESGGIGAVAGFVSSLTSYVDLAMVYRNYAKNFHSFYGNAFGEGTRNINEKGIYWGIKIRPLSKWTIAAYYDYYEFPWLRFRAYSPSKGHEALIRVTYDLSRTVKIYAQYRQESKELNSRDEDSALRYLTDSNKKNYLFNIDFRATEVISLRTRFQSSSFDFEGFTNGYALIQDINLNFEKFRLSSRFAFIDTDDFNNRQYAFERNVLYAFSLPAYYGRSFRNLYLIQYDFNRDLTLWARYAYTLFRDRDEIGSGYDLIDSSKKSDVTIQLRYKF